MVVFLNVNRMCLAFSGFSFPPYTCGPLSEASPNRRAHTLGLQPKVSIMYVIIHVWNYTCIYIYMYMYMYSWSPRHTPCPPKCDRYGRPFLERDEARTNQLVTENPNNKLSSLSSFKFQNANRNPTKALQRPAEITRTLRES